MQSSLLRIFIVFHVLLLSHYCKLNTMSHIAKALNMNGDDALAKSSIERSFSVVIATNELNNNFILLCD